MIFPRCIFCDEELNAETKPEHVLQDALGGRKTTTRVICSACNGRFGEGIDKKLTEQVSIIRNKARVVGAAHAGWKGALTGVLEATLDAMESLGARRASTIAALGPAIGQKSYEVGPEFYERFVDVAEAHAAFFDPFEKEPRFMFDLAGFIGMRLRAAGVGSFEDLALDTYAEPERFFSYRRSVHKKEPDYGRHVSAIALS